MIVVPIVTRVGVLGLTGDYAVQAHTFDGVLLWESEEFSSDDFDYATGTILSDMDHDGSPEIVVGRVIPRADGTTRGRGRRGRSSYGVPPVVGSFASGERPARACWTSRVTGSWRPSTSTRSR